MKYLIYIFFFLGCLFSANPQTYNYEYDANGNMTYDGLNDTRIKYNFLNLPRKVIKGNDTIEYIYDAGGTKLATKKNGEFVNYYAGSMIYNSNKEVEHITYNEGLAVKSGNSYEYQYNLTDHLGNVRAVAGQNGNVIQQNDYYPFGLSHSPTVANFDKNKYLYNGKELQNVGGVNLGYYDYGARSYIPEIGIWTQPDPLTEKYYNHSPFSYAANNPVNVIDPNGMDWVHRTRDGIHELYYDREVSSQEDVINKYGKNGGVTHIPNGATMVHEDVQYTFNNDLENNKYGTVTDKDGNVMDNSQIIYGDDYTIFGTTDNSVNAETLHKNLMSTSYTGSKNPKDYNGFESFQYVPRNLSELPSVLHDKYYSEKQVAGIKGALFNLDVANADLTFAKQSFMIYNITKSPRALVQGAFFGIVGGAKTAVKGVKSIF